MIDTEILYKEIDEKNKEIRLLNNKLNLAKAALVFLNEDKYIKYQAFKNTELTAGEYIADVLKDIEAIK